MRVALLALSLLLVPMAASATSAPMIKSYVGTATRDPLLGPHPVCDVNGENIGGACFELPNGTGGVMIKVTDGISHGMQLLVFSLYNGDVGLPTDGDTVCVKNGSNFWYGLGHTATRIVIAVAPADETEGFSAAGPNCPNFPGTSGTLSVTPS